MKAAVYDRYGPPDVVRIADVPTPEPGTREVRVRTHATTVTSGDWRARSSSMPPGFGVMGRLVFGISRPRQPILGTELSGVIDAIGSDVKTFAVGDAVFAFASASMGCHAEYRCFSANGLVAKKPANLSFDQAAAISFGGMTALSFFRRANLTRGQRVLINGASGGVGTAAVQLARHFGTDVTAVCSAGNVDLVKSLGAHQAIDYTAEDFTANGQRYDVIVDTAGTASYSRVSASLTDRGQCLVVLGGLSDLLRAPIVSMMGNKRIIAGPSRLKADDIRFLADLAAAGEFTPTIDRRYVFNQIADAHRHVDTGRKRGNVVVSLMADSDT